MADAPLDDLRTARNTAKGAFDARLATLRGEIAERGVAGRIADAAKDEAAAALAQGLDIARESKGIIAGTAAALALWFLRNPIIAWAEALLGEDDEDDHDDETATGGNEDQDHG